MDVSDAMQRQAKALADPSRFRVFRYIVEAEAPVGVAELTELLGFNHNAIRQHLAVLREAGLVAEANERRTVRGRPRKEYSVRHDALHAFRSVSGSYQLLATLLLKVANSRAEPYSVGFDAAAPADVAVDQIEDDDVVLAELCRRLAEGGFEPVAREDLRVELQRCPFADVASIDQDVVCELHRGLINGFLSQFGHDLVSELEPGDPHHAGCQVIVGRRRSGSA